MKTNLGIYLHIPFCKEKCSYCDFYSKKGSTHDMDSYTKSLSEHIAFYGSVSKNYIVDTLYIGGGTPSYLGEKNLALLIKSVKKCFKISKNIEITVELNPESTTKKLLKALYKKGVNRISFGVQTANDDKLLQISRLHNFETAKNAVLIAKKIGFKNISIDLIYGLPNQTLDDLKSDLASFLALDVSHISTYALKIEEGTKMHTDGVSTLDDDLVADMYDFICEALKNAGFNHYEVSNFAKNGAESKHNNKYWNLSEYLGLGPSAHSFFGDVRFSYIKDTLDYMKNMTIDEKDERVPKKTRFGEYIMVKLRTSEGIDCNEFIKIFDIPFEPYLTKAEIFIKNGYAVFDGERFFLTEKGFFISNTIINKILED